MAQTKLTYPKIELLPEQTQIPYLMITLTKEQVVALYLVTTKIGGTAEDKGEVYPRGHMDAIREAITAALPIRYHLNPGGGTGVSFDGVKMQTGGYGIKLEKGAGNGVGAYE